MRPRLLAVAVLSGLATVACGTSTAPVTAYKAPATVGKPAAQPVAEKVVLPAATPVRVAPIPPGIPRFRSPEEAMRYLARAWNQRDAAALRHVTNPAARDALEAMHSEAVDLQLRSCEPMPGGDYGCYFSHDYPPEQVDDQARLRGATGQAWFRVGPARRSGWYMTVLEECG